MPHFYDDQCRRAQEGTVNTLLNADLQRMAINLLEDAQLLLLGYGIPRETAMCRIADAQRLMAAVAVTRGGRMQGVTSTPASRYSTNTWAAPIPSPEDEHACLFVRRYSTNTIFSPEDPRWAAATQEDEARVEGG